METHTPGPEALLRTEARERARIISDIAYTIALDLTQGDETFASDTTVTFASSEPGASTFIDLAAPGVESIELNGEQVPVSKFNGHRITLENLKAKNTLRVVASCAYSNSGTGLHFFRDPVDKHPYLHTQFEAREAHKAFTNFDQPDLKATFQISVTAPNGWTIISNTDVKSKPAGGNEGTWVFERTKIMSSYIVAIVAGPYHMVRDKHGDIDLGIYCRQSLAQYLDPDEIFEVTKQGFDFFTGYFATPYPWGTKYDQLWVPEFNAGAMENAAAVTFSESLIFRSKVTDAARETRAGTILHEMAHMWFGDLVTMDWWDDLWLNESFATYMGTLAEARATRFTNAWTRFAQLWKMWAMQQDQMPTTHPIVADVPDTESARTNFDGISYAKGCSALKQLVAWVGEEPFVNGIRNYFKDYEYANASLAEFLGSLEKASGRDLKTWSKEWLETAGVNQFRAKFTADGDTYKTFSLEQTASKEQPTLRSHRIALGLYEWDGSALVRRRRIEIDAVGASTNVEELVGEKIPDLMLINDDDLAYTKIRLDDRSLQTVTEHLAALADPLPRALCWAAASDQLRDAELAARDFVRLVLNNVHVEDDPGTAGQLVAQTSQAFVVYGDPGNRDNVRLQMATRARAELDTAEAGSDWQLIWARTFISNARTDEHLADVRGLLDGTVSFNGLAVDTELRWLIVNALSGLGKIGDEIIEEELKRDPTDAGQRHAASARAGTPTAAAKAEAWRLIVEDDETPYATKRAIAGSFARFDQVELVKPYVEKYFEQLQPMWDTKPPEVAMFFAGAMYPDVIMDNSLVKRTDTYLAEHPDSPPPIKRFLIENRDQLQRSIRAREFDIAAGKRG